MREPAGDLRFSPSLLAVILIVVGVAIFLSLLYNLPVANGRDRDEDGISDTFQKVEPVQDVIKDGDTWKVVTVAYTSSTDLPFTVFAGGTLVVGLPFSISLWYWDRPRKEARTRNWNNEGMMHDIVRRMAAFLEINPSLSSAARMTRTSLSGPGQKLLGRIVWGPFPEGASFDDIYSRSCDEWTKKAPSIGRAMKGLASAEKEGNRTEVMLASRAVVERMSRESKSLMESYSRSLAGPAAALFGVGVLLPILLATMIPVAGITGRTAVLLGFFLWVILPGTIMFMGSRLVLGRPSIGSSHREKDRISISFTALNLTSMFSGLFLVIFPLFMIFTGRGFETFRIKGLDDGSVPLLLGVVGISALSAGIIDSLSREGWKKEKVLASVREISSDFLRNVSTNIAEGHPLEYALKLNLSLERSGVIAVPGIFPGDGPREAGIPEPLCSYLESAREFSKAGKGPGGKAIRAFSKHVQDLLDLEKDLYSRVKGAVGQMEVTASIFAPLMIGASAGIFSLMGSVGSGLPDGMILGGGGQGALKASQFLLLSGGYLLILSVVNTLTIYRLENGRTWGGWHRVPRRLVQSSLAFCGGVIASSLLLG